MSILNNMELDTTDSRFLNNDFKMKELNRWKNYYGVTIMRDNYKTENELDDDWGEFNNIPGNMRFICDDKCNSLFGMDNESLYKKMKSKFLKAQLPDEDIVNYYGETIKSDPYSDDIDETKIKQNISRAEKREFLMNSDIKKEEDKKYQNQGLGNVEYLRRYSGIVDEDVDDSHDIINNLEDDIINHPLEMSYINNSDYVIIPMNMKTEDDLIDRYYQYKSMDDDRRRRADEMSIEIYGIDNEENYQRQLKKFLRQDIKDEYDNPNYDDGYSPDDPMSYIGKVSDSIEEHSDIVTNVWRFGALLENSNNFMGSAVYSAMDYIKNKLTYSIKDMYSRPYISNAPYLTPDEFYNNAANTGKAWLAGYTARYIGLNPEIHYYNMWKQEAIGEYKTNPSTATAYGLLPSGGELTIESFENSSKRANDILTESIGYGFIPIYTLPKKYTLRESKYTSPTPSGISIVFITGENLDDNSPRIGIYPGKIKDKFYPIRNGSIGTEISLAYYRNNDKNISVSIYFLPVSDSIVKKVKKVIQDSISRKVDVFDTLRKVCIRLSNPNPEVADERSMCAYILDSIISASKEVGKTFYPQITFNYPFDKLENVYILYKGEGSNSDLLDAYNGLTSISNGVLYPKNPILTQEEYKLFKPFITVEEATEEDFGKMTEEKEYYTWKDFADKVSSFVE